MDFKCKSSTDVIQILSENGENASIEDVDFIYKRLSMKYHPDKGGSAAEFQNLQVTCELVRKHGLQYVKMLSDIYEDEGTDDLSDDDSDWSYAKQYEEANIDDFKKMCEKIVNNVGIPSFTIETASVVEHEQPKPTRKRKLTKEKVEVAPKKRHSILKGKSIIVYGGDDLKEGWGLSTRPRLLIQDATADIENLSSVLLKNTCCWLDGPLINDNMTSLCDAVNNAYTTIKKDKSVKASKNAHVTLLSDATGTPEEAYWIGHLRNKVYNRKTKEWLYPNRGGFGNLLR